MINRNIKRPKEFKTDFGKQLYEDQKEEARLRGETFQRTRKKKGRI